MISKFQVSKKTYKTRLQLCLTLVFKMNSLSYLKHIYTNRQELKTMFFNMTLKIFSIAPLIFKKKPTVLNEKFA